MYELLHLSPDACARFTTASTSLPPAAVQADVLSSITPEAIAALAGDPVGPAAFLLIRLAFLVALVAGFPLLMGPFRSASWLRGRLGQHWDSIQGVLQWQACTLFIPCGCFSRPFAAGKEL